MSTTFEREASALPNPPPLTDHQKELVKATVPVLEQHGTEITKVFYKTMLDEHPELRNNFNHSKQQVCIHLVTRNYWLILLRGVTPAW